MRCSYPGSFEAVVVQVGGEVGVSAVVHRNVDQGRPLLGERLTHGGTELVQGLHPVTTGSESRCVGDDVVVAELHAGFAFVLEDFLEAHHVVGVVAEDDVRELQPQAGRGLEFLCGEQESAVSGDGHDGSAGPHQAGGHRPGQGHTEGLLPVGKQQPSGFVDAEVACHVDVDRADVAGDGGGVVEFFAQPQHHGDRVEPGTVRYVSECGGIYVGQGFSLRDDLGSIVAGEGEPGQVVGQGGEGGRDVAEQFQGGLIVVVDVGRNRVDVHDGAPLKLWVAVPLHRVVFDGVVSDGDQA